MVWLFKDTVYLPNSVHPQNNVILDKIFLFTLKFGLVSSLPPLPQPPVNSTFVHAGVGYSPINFRTKDER